MKHLNLKSKLSEIKPGSTEYDFINSLLIKTGWKTFHLPEDLYRKSEMSIHEATNHILDLIP